MGLKGIIAISGMPGLYKVLAQTKSGFIVEAMADKKRLPVSSMQRISMLEDISVFTNADDLPLKEVMDRIKNYSATEALIDPKADAAALKEFFKKVIPEFDENRVYTSDIKKIVAWFHLIKDVLDLPDEEESPSAEGSASTADNNTSEEQS